MYRKVEKIYLKGEPGFSRTAYDYSKWCDTMEQASSEIIIKGYLEIGERIKNIFTYLEYYDGKNLVEINLSTFQVKGFTQKSEKI